MTHTEEYGVFAKVEGMERQVALESIDVNVKITGSVSEISMKQEYVNTESVPIEAIFKFPLIETATVTSLKIFKNDLLIEAVAEEKEQAYKIYDDELSKGNGAYLLEENRPNIFTLNVGNMNPDDSLSVEISLISTLEMMDNEKKFVLPTTISPRYIPPYASEENGIPVDEVVHPEYALSVPYSYNLNIEIENLSNDITNLESPSHPISVKFDDKKIMVSLSREGERMDRDFILKIFHKEDFKSEGYVTRLEDGLYGYVNFICEKQGESKKKEENNIEKEEFIFVLDCSGSMGGSSIESAKKALEIMVRGLNKGCHFNIYRFGSTFKKHYPKSVEYNDDNFTEAIRYIRSINADLGGTEILPVIMDLYQQKVEDKTLRKIIVITDGEVGNEDQVCREVTDKKHTNLFTVGIGYGPNRYFIKKLAEVGGGADLMISPDEDITLSVTKFFSNILKTFIKNVHIETNDGLKVYPKRLNLFEGEAGQFFFRLEGNQNEIESVNIVSKHFKKEVKLSKTDSTFISKLWAKNYINYLQDKIDMNQDMPKRKENKYVNEIVDISKKFNIISAYTSFVAVEKRKAEDKTLDYAQTRKIPLVITRNWHGTDSCDFDADLCLGDSLVEFCSPPSSSRKKRYQKTSGRQVKNTKSLFHSNHFMQSVNYLRYDEHVCFKPLESSISSNTKTPNEFDEILSEILLNQTLVGYLMYNQEILEKISKMDKFKELIEKYKVLDTLNIDEELKIKALDDFIKTIAFTTVVLEYIDENCHKSDTYTIREIKNLLEKAYEWKDEVDKTLNEISLFQN